MPSRLTCSPSPLDTIADTRCTHWVPLCGDQNAHVGHNLNVSPPILHDPPSPFDLDRILEDRLRPDGLGQDAPAFQFVEDASGGCIEIRGPERATSVFGGGSSATLLICTTKERKYTGGLFSATRPLIKAFEMGHPLSATCDEYPLSLASAPTVT